ncbi:metalloregulator ArsR/SmtB family transcription factor [Chromobacterium vaccinii]|nr:metalloregulator ArsR/SmtB family transcription factor [Chromobacterium piscinae]MBX9296069.1 metalloregulator ArsR/SmtB family transcription factor [Chromobacterium vaccinii]MBX9346660.1 metalloregulator ArsR/SmtB family transcription factor [Chromobacterium vaccinii]MBX9355701.1 metalloregulator ArsR/SmtB family transcription factor [Chromobacterium vaccinii]MCD4504345.1 metalloregulator ArsR/SmtB family transcription factor [Chromobacterium piscinae]MCD5327363.1 metalloregulator ArsR/Smt
METKNAVTLLAALAQDTRLGIYRLLVQKGPEGLSVGQIGEQLAVANATLSFHLKELSHSGLIRARQEGRFIYYSANYEQMNALLGFLTENCCRGEACTPASSMSPCPDSGCC